MRRGEAPARRGAGRFGRRRRFAFGSDPRREVDEEIAAHLEHSAQALAEGGLAPDAAAREARRRFGDARACRRSCATIDRRRMRRRRWEETVGNLARDLQLAVRLLRRSPGFTAAAVLTLALGIGANTAVFSVFYGVLLRPLPFPRAERLVNVFESNPLRGWTKAEAAPANYLDWRQARPSPFADLAAYEEGLDDVALTGAGEPRVFHLAAVTGNFFSVLGVPPVRGRGFAEAETWSTAGRVAVLSDQAWHRHFAADPGIVGTVIHLNGRAVQVIGIMPAGFDFPYSAADAWTPVRWDPAAVAKVFFRRAHDLRVVGRLRPGAALGAARSYLAQTAARLAKRYPETNVRMGAGAEPLQDAVVGSRRRPLAVLFAAVALVLLAACVNLSLLQLVHGSRRARELVVRRAIGASRPRLLRQLATESLLLSLLGGAAGVGLGWASLRALLRLSGDGLLGSAAVRLDGGVLLFAALATALAGLAAGLAPALLLTGGQAGEALRAEAGAGRLALRQGIGRDSLVAAEVALAAILAVGCGLLGRSFQRLQEVPAGYHARHVLLATLSLPSARYAGEAAIRRFDQGLLERVRALPGVAAATLADGAPLIDFDWTGDFFVEGSPGGGGVLGVEFHHRLIAPGYLETLGVPLLRGRTLRDSDDAAAPAVVLINETLARRYFPGQDPIGWRLQFEDHPDPSRPWRTIVGVVGDERRAGRAAPPWPEIYVSTLQEPEPTLRLLVRTALAEPRSLLPAVRRAVGSLDRNLPVYDVRTMDEVAAAATARERFLLVLMAAFAGIVLSLAVVGIFGVVASAVARRTREIGLRIALGARPLQVLRGVAGRGLALAAAGLACGLAAALGAARLLGALLFEVSAADPATFAAAGAILLLAACGAAWLPARAALRIDPSRTLRQD